MKRTIYQTQICPMAQWMDVGIGWIMPDRAKELAEALARHGLKARVVKRQEQTIRSINPEALKCTDTPETKNPSL